MSISGHAESDRPPLFIRSGLAVVLALFLNVGLVLGANAAGIAPEFRAVSLLPVAFLSVVGAAGAAVVYWLAHRYAADGDRTFLRIAGGVVVLSFVPDLALLAVDPAATPAGVVILMGMHVVVAAIAVWLLVSWRREQ